MNLREAAQQALDELIAADGMPICNETDILDLSKTITALRAALAEDVPETNFGNMAQVVDCYGDGNVYHTNGMPAVEGPLSKAHRTCHESRQVEPVAYVTGFTKGRCTIDAVDPAWLPPVGMALYRSPTINKTETVEPVAWLHEWDGTALLNTVPPDYYGDHWKHTPLYTAPPQRTPLTDEQLVEAYCCVNDKEWAIGGMTDARIFARAIERAHGIGGEG